MTTQSKDPKEPTPIADPNGQPNAEPSGTSQPEDQQNIDKSNDDHKVDKNEPKKP